MIPLPIPGLPPIALHMHYCRVENVHDHRLHVGAEKMSGQP
jgi:hypothetical protein